MAQKITPNIWFNGNAKEAVEFYQTVFPNVSIVSTAYYPTEGLADFQKDMAGKELVVEYEIDGFHFTAINAGPEFQPNPAISFFVNLGTKEEVDGIWKKLIEGGKALMELSQYPFSEYYGWVQDKYGVNWQLRLAADETSPRIVPSLMFTGDKAGKAEEAANYYAGIFEDSKVGFLSRYAAGQEPDVEGTLNYGELILAGQKFTVMDSALDHDFSFNEGVSLLITCKDQAEIDYFWEKLSTVPEAEQCGWCKDKYGVSWQVGPENMEELMKKPGAFAKMMEMKKLVIADF